MMDLFFRITPLLFLPLISLGSSAIEKKYPDLVITPSHGILTEDDLAYSDSLTIAHPYNPNDGTNGLYWQCLPVKNVKIWYDTDQQLESPGFSNVMVTLCEFEIRVQHGGEKQLYHDRRRHEVAFCRDLFKNWKKLTTGEAFVCLSGWGGQQTKDEKNRYSKLWVWEDFKTKKGCYSYIGGTNCDTKGFAEKLKRGKTATN